MVFISENVGFPKNGNPHLIWIEPCHKAFMAANFPAALTDRMEFVGYTQSAEDALLLVGVAYISYPMPGVFIIADQPGVPLRRTNNIMVPAGPELEIPALAAIEPY
jgi:hypothetical protein